MFDNIVIFISLVEIGSFSKTAEVLNSSQTTISRKIVALEKHVGQRLFIRDTRNLQLSQAGIVLYNKFKFMNQDLKDAIVEINPSTQRVDNNETLTVCLYNAISYELICPYIKNYINENPKIKLDLVFYSVDLINEIDFDIGVSHRSLDLPEYHIKQVRNDSLKLYATPQYVTQYGLPRTIDELKQHSFVGSLENRNNQLTPIANFVLLNKYTGDEQLFNINKYSQIKTNSASCSKQLGSYSDNIFWCWESLCEQDVIAGRLIPILSEFNVSKDNIFYLVYRNNLSQAGAKFCDFLYKCMEKKLGISSFRPTQVWSQNPERRVMKALTVYIMASNPTWKDLYPSLVV